MSGINEIGNFVRLTSSGQLVNLLTSRGANAYLLEITRVDGFAVFVTDLKTANVIRKKGGKKNKRINASDRQILVGIYDKISNVAEFSDPRLFRRLVPESEISAVLDHFVEIYQARTTDPTWINTGSLQKYDFPSLACMFAMFKHPVPVAMALLEENRLLETLTMMMRARQGTSNRPLPTEFAEAIVIMTSNLVDCSMSRFDNPWTAEKVFKKMEAIGFLEQYLRCTALPASGDIIDDAKTKTFDSLLTCTAFVNKRFKQGTTCGDTVRSFLKAQGGQSIISHRALPYFKSLVQLSELLQAGNDARQEATCCCCCCKKKATKEKLLTCSRCRIATYCSKECQKKHWNEHKKNCAEPPKSSSEKNRAALCLAVMNTVKRHYTRIMLKLIDLLDQDSELHMYDVMVELDFTADANGKVPILQDPPEFEIIPLSKYLEGGPVSSQCFLRVSGDGVEVEEETVSEVQNVMKHMKERQARKASTDLLCLARRKDTLSFITLDPLDPESRRPLFSLEAMEAIRSVTRDNDYTQMSKIVSNGEEIEKLKANLEYLLGENT